METERQQAIDGQLGNGKSPDNSATRILKWCKDFAGAVRGAISPKKSGQREARQDSEDRVGKNLDRIRTTWDSLLAQGDQEEAASRTEGRKLGPPEVIEQFNKIGIRLSCRDDGTYNEWYVFPDPASTSVIVSPSYKKGLDEVTTKQIAAIKFALGSGILTKSQIVFALIKGEPSFDSLIQRATDNLPKL